jgi:hypothetical protein
MDESWSQRPHDSNKMMNFDLIEEQVGFVHDSRFGLSNRMGAEDVRHLIEQWKAVRYPSDKARSSVHNRDVKACSHLRLIEHGTKSLDPNHVMEWNLILGSKCMPFTTAMLAGSICMDV